MFCFICSITILLKVAPYSFCHLLHQNSSVLFIKPYIQCLYLFIFRLYDKRDDFDFHIVNFPFLSSNIPSGPSYGVYISQLIRYARCCSHYDDFRYRHKCLVDRLLSQGYKALRLEKSFKKFYGRYQDLIEKYRRSVNAMVSDSFPGQCLFNM